MMTEQFKFSDRAKRILIGLMITGLVGMVLTFFMYGDNQHSRFWSNLLLNTYFFTGISLVGMFFATAHQLGYGGWITLVKRIPESMAKFVAVLFAFALLIILGTVLDWHNLYAHWTHHQDEPLIKGKSALLNKTTWSSINIIFYVLWIALIYWYHKTSTSEDSMSFGANYKKMRAIAATFLVVFGVSQSIGSWTWIMSIDPHWYSTLFGWYNFASYAGAGMAFMILIFLYLKSRGYLKLANENHLHDLGKFMFGFSVFWAYLWFSQFMLQWYANIPEDTAFWYKRWNVGWFKFWFYASLFVNFVVPFFFLLARGAKRHQGRMVVMALIVIFGHYIDFYNMIMFEPNMPNTEHHSNSDKHSNLSKNNTVLYADASHGHSDASKSEHGKGGHEMKNEHNKEHKSGEAAHDSHHDAPSTFAGLFLPELMIFLGFVGMFLFTVFTVMSKHSLIPTNDIYLKESMNHHI